MRKDILRQENYGIPIGEEITRTARTYNRNSLMRGKGHNYNYTVEYQFVETNKRLKLQRGDIVSFDQSDYLPKYAQGQFGVVIDRYRLVKDKYITFRDYCCVLMVITGSEKGRVFKFPGSKAGVINKYIQNEEDDEITN